MSSNQSAKYKKFIVGAASAALVASAVAPVASAKDFTDTKDSTHKDAINALVEAGIANGYKDGSFKPNQELTRANVVKFLGKWLVAEGKEIPADAVSNPRFKDLKPTSEKELLEYAALVFDNGIFSGSNGNLLPSDKMTRQNMANVIVRAFDNVKGINLVEYVKAQDFERDVKDLDSAYENTRGAIEVVDFFNITNPGVANFRPKDATTRGQFASFLSRALNTDYSEVKVDVDQVAVDAAAEQVKAGAVTVARGNYATDANKQAAVEAYVNSLITEKDVIATVTAGTTAGEYAVTLTKGEAKAEKTIAVTFDFAADDRFVTEVNALNATQVEVKFSSAVDKASLFTDGKSGAFKATVTLGSLDTQLSGALKGELSADGKTLKITAENALSKRYDVVVDGLKSVTGAAFDKFENTISIEADKTAPTILGTERVSASQVKVKFSEPMKAFNATTFKYADGSTVTGITGDVAAGAEEVLFTLTEAVTANKEIVSTFIGAQDQAGNLITPNPATVSFTKGDLDGMKPTISKITQLGDKKFELKFSEEIQNLSKENVTIDGNATVSVTKDNTDSTKYIIEVTNSLEGAKIVKVQNFKDLSGEVGNTTGKAVTFVKDAAAPKVNSTNVVVDETDGKEYLELTFDKEVTASNATIQASNVSYVLNHVTTSGLPLAAKDLKVKDGSNNKILRVALEDLLGEHATKEGAVFTLPLTLTNVKSEAGVAVTTALVEVKRGKDGSVANSDLVKVTEVAQNGTDTNSVVVTFNGDVDAESATNATNYTIDGAKVQSATVKSNDPKKVYLTLEANSNAFTGIRNATIKNVEKAGSTLVMEQQSIVTGVLKENVVPTITEAKLNLASGKITLTFSENVYQVANSTGDFELLLDGKSVATSAIHTDSFLPIVATSATDKAEFAVTLSAEQALKAISLKAITDTIDIVDAEGNKLSVPADILVTQ